MLPFSLLIVGLRNLDNCEQLRGSDQMMIQRNPPATTMLVEVAWLGGQGASGGWGSSLESELGDWFITAECMPEKYVRRAKTYLFLSSRGQREAQWQFWEEKCCVANRSFSSQHFMPRWSRTGRSLGIQQCAGLPTWVCHSPARCHCASYCGRPQLLHRRTGERTLSWESCHK